MINSHAIASMGARRGARVGRCPPPPPPRKYKKYFWAILGAFLLRFSHFGGLFTMWGPFCYFLLHGGGVWRNLVSSGHVCYDFALKMTKIMINCSHVPARWGLWRHANSRKMLINGAIWSVFWYDFSLRKF